MAGPPPGEYESAQTHPPDSDSASDMSSSKAGWYDPQHNMPPWNPQQPVSGKPFMFKTLKNCAKNVL